MWAHTGRAINKSDNIFLDGYINIYIHMYVYTSNTMD